MALYDKDLAENILKSRVRMLENSLTETRSNERLLRNAIRKASELGIDDEQIYNITVPVHEHLDIMGRSDVHAIVMEES